MKGHKHSLYAGLVWIGSATALVIYCIVAFFNASLPGVPEPVAFLATIQGKYIYAAALVSIFVEGLYVLGSFFPGSGLVVVLAVLSQMGGFSVFFTTILTIFIGWSLAGAVNVYLAKIYRIKLLKLSHDDSYEIKSHPWVTWFPAFRASHEVAQVLAGGKPLRVFLSSLWVRLWACVFMGLVTYMLPSFFDVNEAGDKEGFAAAGIIAAISFVIGIKKVRKYLSSKNAQPL